MRITKKPAIILLMIMSMLCLIFGAVACGGNGGVSAKEAIERYLLPQNETLVTEDFTLPKTIGSADSPITVEWKSSNTAAIAIEDGGENYNAKVTIQDQVTEVTLTISAEDASKSFTVRVDGFSVYTFLDNFKFTQKNAAVKADFDLETETTYQGKKATISWEIDEEKYGDYIKLNDAKNKVLVTPGEKLQSVEISATFSYNNETATQKYIFSVSPNLDHLQNVNNIYSQSGIPLEFEGYVLHVYVAANDAKYGPMASFFAVDNDFCSGYYIWQAALESEEDVAKVVPGAHFTFSGDVTKNYNGLWESNGYEDGTAVFDGATPINIDEHIRAFDIDYLSEVQSAKWQMSRLVTLTGWTVKTVATDDDKENTKLTLTNGGKDIDVYTSTYVTTDDAAMTALKTKLKGLTAGSFVNIKGILGYNEGYRLQPRTADDVTSATAAATYEDATKVNAAVKKVAAEVEKSFSGLITSDTEVKMPISEQGVTISYKVAGATNPTVTIGEDGTFTVNPIDTQKNYDIQVTYTLGEYTAYSFFNLRNQKASPDVIVGEVVKQLQEQTIGDFNGPGQISLPALKDDMGTTIEWSVKDGDTLTWVKVEHDAKNKKDLLTIAPMPASTTQVTVVATVSLQDEKQIVEYTITVRVGDFNLLNTVPADGGEFVLSAMHYGKRVYATGTLDKDTGAGFLNTTDDLTKAAKMKIEKKDSNWLIKVGTKYLEVNPYPNNDKASYNIRLVDTATAGAVWEWDDTLKIFKQKPVATEEVTPDDAYFYIGMRDNATYTTMSPSNVSYITGNNAANLDVVQHPARFGVNPFKAIDAPAAGDYAFSAIHKGERLYASSLELSGNYIATSNDAAKAVKFTIEKKDSNWLIKMGAKYLEVDPYKGKNGTSYRLRLVDNATEGAVWVWDSDIKIFKQKPITTDAENAPAADAYFYIGTYDSSNYDTLSPSNISYITGDNAKNLDISQHPGRFGTVEVVEGTTPGGGTTQPEPEEPTLEATKGTDIVETGATVFDFTAVEKGGTVLTNEQVLAAFPSAATVGLTAVEATNIYAGNGSGGPTGYQDVGGFLKSGKSKTNGTLKLTFSKKVSKVQILCLGWTASDTIAIDGFKPATVGNTAKVAYTFELAEAMNSFTITTADRAFIFKIAVTFAD